MSPAYSAQPVGQDSPVPTDEAELVRRARDNDPWAADQLVRRYQKKVYGIAYRLCGFDPEEARDTAQEAFLQAFRNISQFEGRSRFSTWLYRVAVNACLDAQRRRRRWVDMILPWREKKQDGKDAANQGSSFEKDIDTFDTMDLDNVTDKIRNDCKTMIKQLHLDHLMER